MRDGGAVTTWVRKALVSAAAVLALSISACGGGGSGETTLSNASSPREIVEAASLRGVHSGRFDTGVGVNKLKTKESIGFHAAGSFKGLGEGEQPQINVVVSAQGAWKGRKIDLDSLLLALPEGGMVSYGTAAVRKPFRIGRSTLHELRSKLSAADEEGGAGDLGACLDALGEFNFDELILHPEIEERRQEPDGTKVVVVNGPIDFPRLYRLVDRLARDPACGAQMTALGLPSAAELETLEVDFKKGFPPHLALTVDKHGIIRELVTRFECARLHGELFELQLNFLLSEVNQQIEVAIPIEGQPLDALLRRFGTSVEAVLNTPSSEAVVGFLGGIGALLSGRRS